MNEAKIFYGNLDTYHKKVKDIIKVIIGFYAKYGISSEGEIYKAIRFENNKIVETNIKLSKEEKERIENWLTFGFKVELSDSIYKLDIENNIFLFKMFTFNKNKNKNDVFAGYLLEQSYELRSFLLDFRTKKIQKNVNNFVSI